MHVQTNRTKHYDFSQSTLWTRIYRHECLLLKTVCNTLVRRSGHQQYQCTQGSLFVGMTVSHHYNSPTSTMWHFPMHFSECSAAHLQSVNLISAPSHTVIIVNNWLCLSVCLSVTLLQIASSFLFLDGIEPFFGRHLSVWHSTKRCSSIFDLGPPNVQNLYKIENRL